MFPVNLIRHSDPELFFAIAAPVGADVETVCSGLERVLNGFEYSLHTIRVIEELKRIDGYLENESDFFDKQLENRMNEGDRFRKETRRDDAVVLPTQTRLSNSV
jgi:hypothetical protein